ncbi:YSIRK-targeted surface antigen transcriptional regulator [Staphylococcus condimenti]|nr:YSIRK-targeted surface antigen transcriptional regulator [Staphylococcus condimenti]
MKEKSILKSLHISLDVNIKAYDSNYNEILKYTTEDKSSSLINEVGFIKAVKNELNKDKYFILTSVSNNIYLLHYFEGKHYLFGPFKADYLPPDSALTKVLNTNSIEEKIIRTDINHGKNTRIYSIEDISDIVQLVNYLLGLELKGDYVEPLGTYVKNLNDKVKEMSLDKFFYINYEKEKQKLQFEDQLINLVKSGNPEILKRSLKDMVGGIMPPQNEESLRNEKNYSIIVFEKLSQIAIEVGMDVIEAIRIRDQLMLDNESAKDNTEIMRVRNGATLIFAKKIGEIVDENLSPFLMSVLQYIHNNLYQDLSLFSIAKEFNVSSTTLNLTFKNELGMTVKKYLTKSKIEDAKKLLTHDLSISEISQMLAFADSSHFCKKFKKETGMTPTEYKRKNKT